MSTETKKNKIKQFIADHPAEVFAGVVTAGALGLYAFATANAAHAAKKAVKARDEFADLTNQLIAKADEDGKAVFMLHDWSFLLVPKETPTEWIKF
ncbi:membrane protein [Arthrobacter phage Tokki]|nr:membrane protein [Arthrobacter phage Tokki]